MYEYWGVWDAKRGQTFYSHDAYLVRSAQYGAGGIMPMNENVTLTKGPLDVERWNEGFMSGVKRWKGAQVQRSGLGDSVSSNGQMFCEMYTTMRQISMRIKLPRTHQQRAVSSNMARATRNPAEFKEGWVEITIDSDSALQDALTLARQGYLETQR